MSHHKTIRERFVQVFVLAALCATTLTACSRDTANGNDSDKPEFRVALLTPGPISDKAWNGGAYEGLLSVRDSLGATISHIQTKTPADFEENFRQYGAQGYRLVIGHGFEFQVAALSVAPDYPGTIYICTSGDSTAVNVSGMNFALRRRRFRPV